MACGTGRERARGETAASNDSGIQVVATNRSDQNPLQFIDDLLQTALNWLPSYWSLVPILLRPKSHEDRFTPVPILSIADMKKDTNLGELLYDRAGRA